MKSIILALLVLTRVASAQVCPGLVTDQTMTGKFCTSSPASVRVKTGGGLSTGGGVGGLTLEADCSSGQVLKWNGSAWACAAGGAITGTQNHLVKIDSTGLAGVDSSTVDNGTNITMVEPIVRTLGSGSAFTLWSTTSTNDPSAAGYSVSFTENPETNGVSPTNYYDHTMQFGWNYNGARIDTAQSANWQQFESNYYSGGKFRSEFHIATEGTDGIERRRYTQTSALDGSEGEGAFAATTMTFLGWDGATIISQLTTSLVNNRVATQVNADSTTSNLIVKSLTGDIQEFRVGTTSSEFDVPVGIATTTLPQLLLLNTAASGSVEIDLRANNAALTALISEGSDGSMVFRNSATGGATYFDIASGGFNMRNSSFANTLTVSNAGNVDAPLGRVSGLTLRTAGATGPVLAGGTGVPAISCTIGDEFLRTDGGVGTVLYTCTATNTWTAMGGGSGTITGSGTANTTTKFTGTSAIGNAWALDDGTTWGVSSKFTITEATGNTAVNGTLTADAGSRVIDTTASSARIVQTANSIDLATTITGGSCTSCNLTYDAYGRLTVAANGSGGGITNSAGNNVIMKSNGTNAVASSISDSGTAITTAEPVTISKSSASAAFAGFTVANTGTNGSAEIDFQSTTGGGGSNTASLTLDASSNAVFENHSGAFYFDYANGGGVHFRNTSFADMLSLNGTGGTFPGTLTSTGAFTASSTEHVVGAVTDDSTLNVAGLFTATGAISVSGGVSAIAGGLSITGKGWYSDQLIDQGTLFTLVSGTAQNLKGATSGTFTASGTTETITFGITFTVTPTCVISTDGTAKGYSYTRSTTQLTFASLTNGQKYDFDCRGH